MENEKECIDTREGKGTGAVSRMRRHGIIVGVGGSDSSH